MDEKDRKWLRKYWRGNRSYGALSAYRKYTFMRHVDDTLDHPPGSRIIRAPVRQIPVWVIVQAHRFAIHTTLIPEAERRFDSEAPIGLTRNALIDILGVPESQIRRTVAPKLTESQQLDLLAAHDTGKLRGGVMPNWIGMTRRRSAIPLHAIYVKHPWPPPEIDPWIPERFYDDWCQMAPGVLDDEPVQWRDRWDISRFQPNLPLPTKRTQNPQEDPDPTPPHPQEDLANQLRQLLEDD